jgi:hypothetical protein
VFAPVAARCFVFTSVNMHVRTETTFALGSSCLRYGCSWRSHLAERSLLVVACSFLPALGGTP